MHGCYPLILDSNDEFRESSNLRKSAAIKCLADIASNYEALFNLISGTESWDQTLQNQIMEQIPDPNTEEREL
jgi:hypothetical protein